MIRSAFLSVVVFTVLCGLIYPFAVTGAAQAFFPRQADGLTTLVAAQPFDDAAHFWGRAQVVTNYGPRSPDLHEAVAARIDALRKVDPTNRAPVPIDLVTASGSGLDPDISPAAAYYQAARVARARNVPEAEVRAMIDRHVEGRVLGILGDPHVDVLELNLDLDTLTKR
ncbi:MAG TPA: potassium-transporting ATPase subunit C [Kofleriaceae bacterium]|jgi:K+-transporting ATPase ATPase C chain|nr:potassium-transporting ATPase subunit C [Kofleriaceae bacterium]